MGFRNIPQTINDIYLVDGNDFQLSSTNDLLLVNGSDLSTQRIVRRLLTTPPSYIWHSDYGAGLPQYVGEPLTDGLFDTIKGVILSQIFLENTVAQTPAPQIFLSSIQFGLFCQINYTLNVLLQPVVITFEVE